MIGAALALFVAANLFAVCPKPGRVRDDLTLTTPDPEEQPW